MPITLTLALRNLWRHPWRTIATVLGMATGIAAVLATLSLGVSVQRNMEGILTAAAGRAALIVSPGVDGRAVFEYAETLEVLLASDEVADAWPVLRYRTEPIRRGEVDTGDVVTFVDSGFQLNGFVMGDGAELPFSLTQGRLPEPGEQAVLLAEDFALQRGYSLGDEVEFATQFGNAVLVVTGWLDGSTGLGAGNFGRVGAMELAVMQDMLRLSGRASVIEVELAQGVQVAAAMDRLQAQLGEQFTVSTPEATGDIPTGLINAFQAGLSILAVTLMALAGFLAFNTFNATVLERSREFALLRTICMTRTQVRKLALLEAALTSVLGVAAGLLLGVGLAWVLTYVNGLMIGVPVTTITLPFGNFILAAVLGVGVTLLAGVLPAVSASRTPALAALRGALEEKVLPGVVAGGWVVITVAVAVALWPWEGNIALAAAAVSMSFLFLGLTLVSPALLVPLGRLMGPLLGRLFGVAGRLGTGMARRNATRNGVAIGMVVVGMALTVGIGSMVAGVNKTVSGWIETTILGDLFLTTPATFPDGFEEQAMAAVPGMEAVSGVGLNAIRFEPPDGSRARTVALVLADPERFHPETGFGEFQYYRSRAPQGGSYEVLLRGEVLVASVLTERFGIQVGDTISLRTIDGFRDFTVGGIIVDFTSGGEAVVGGWQLAGLFGGGNPDLYVVRLEEGASAADAAAGLRQAFPRLHLDVTANDEYRDEILGQANDMFMTTNLLVALAVFISALGVANTLGMNLSTRQHELAVLRTVGMKRRGVMALVTAEGLVVTITGAVAGILAGILLSRVVTRGASALSGFELLPDYPPLLLIAALVASPVVGLLASYFPARRAARLAPVRALSSEE